MDHIKNVYLSISTEIEDECEKRAEEYAVARRLKASPAELKYRLKALHRATNNRRRWNT